MLLHQQFREFDLAMITEQREEHRFLEHIVLNHVLERRHQIFQEVPVVLVARVEWF